MVAIALTDCDIQESVEGGYHTYLLITPATADSANTIDLSDIMYGRSVRGLSAWDSSGEDAVTCTLAVSTDVITIDVGGATMDHVYNIRVVLK